MIHGMVGAFAGFSAQSRQALQQRTGKTAVTTAHFSSGFGVQPARSLALSKKICSGLSQPKPRVRSSHGLRHVNCNRSSFKIAA